MLMKYFFVIILNFLYSQVFSFLDRGNGSNFIFTSKLVKYILIMFRPLWLPQTSVSLRPTGLISSN